MSQATSISRPSDRKLAELRAAITRRPDVQAAMKRAPAGLLNEVLGGFTRAIRDDPRLVRCDGQTILDSLFDAMDLGLVPGREGYFIRYGERCHFHSGYRGILRLVMQAGVKKVDVREVRQGDVFRVELGDEERITHSMSPASDRDKSPISHVYAVALLADGERKREVWTAQRIEEHKEQFSEAWKRADKKGTNDSPWHTSWLAMAQKTVLLALCKLLPQTTAMQRMMQVEDKAEGDNTLDAAFTVASRAAEAKPTEEQDKLPSEDAPESPEPTPEQSTGAKLSEAAQERIDALLIDLGACVAIKQVQDRLATSIEASESVDEELAAKDLADVQIDKIRAGRGERSNKKK
jgi:recombination protein RecT